MVQNPDSSPVRQKVWLVRQGRKPDLLLQGVRGSAAKVAQVMLLSVTLASKGQVSVFVDISKAQSYSRESPGGLWAW